MSKDNIFNALEKIFLGTATASSLESETLDFKEDGRSLKDFMSDVSSDATCFANAGGGCIVIGVDNNVPGPQAFLGTRIDEAVLHKKIFETTVPHLVVDVRKVNFKGHDLIFVTVPQSPEIHSDSSGRIRRRFMTDCLPMKPADVARMRQERQGWDWSAQKSDAPLVSASPLALARVRDRLRRLPDRRKELAAATDADLLRALGLCDETASFLNRAGLLLLGEAEVGGDPDIVYQFKSTPGAEATFVERLSRPLALALERTLEIIQARTESALLNLPNGQQLSLQDFPNGAVREAVVNALVHRDFSLSGSVQIEHSRRTMSIQSPGPLVAGITPENILTHPSKPRNRLLCKAVSSIGWAEELGRGMDRIYKEMIRAGHALPEIHSGADSVRVHLAVGTSNTAIAKFLATLPDQEGDDTDTLLIVHSLCRTKMTSAEAMSKILQKPETECEEVLRRLCADRIAILEPTRQTASRSKRKYRLRTLSLQALGPAVAYNRRTVDDTDRKVIAHVKEYSRITNRSIQNMLEVGIQRAKQILGDLVAREILVKTSPQARGPGIEYGPGPKFPHSAGQRKKIRPD